MTDYAPRIAAYIHNCRAPLSDDVLLQNILSAYPETTYNDLRRGVSIAQELILADGRGPVLNGDELLRLAKSGRQ